MWGLGRTLSILNARRKPLTAVVKFELPGLVIQATQTTIGISIMWGKGKGAERSVKYLMTSSWAYWPAESWLNW